MKGPDKVFIDSNILIYLIDNSSTSKKQIVEELILPGFVISTQVIAENVSVCLKKLKLDKNTTFDFAKKLISRLQTVVITPEILIKSFEVVGKYQVSSWDAIILSTALHYNCTTVYSEDMQNGLVIEKTLTLINPLRPLHKNDPFS